MKLVTATLLTVLVSFASVAQAQDLLEIERTGLESNQPAGSPETPALRGAQRGIALDDGLLLIPESTNDRVMAFDPETGDLIDADFIPTDAANLATPIEVVLNDAQDAFLVSDQISDGVFAYDLSGAPLGLFAPAGGIDNSILDNVRGIAVDPANGNLLVTTASSANADAIAEFDTTGAYIGNRVAIGAGGMSSPFDVLVDAGEILVPAINSDAVHRYDLTGTFIADFAAVDTFAEQIAPRIGGGYFVANFSGAQEGIIEFDAAGAVLNVFDPPSLGGYRGVFELGNGNLLITNGGGVHEIDRTGTPVETKIADVSARFITFVQTGDGEGPVLPESVPVPVLDRFGQIALLLIMLVVGLVAIRRAA